MYAIIIILLILCSGCLATVKTPFIEPDTPWNKSENIMVGGCDNGPLTYGVGYDDNGSGAMTIYLTFYSHAVLDASHPACQITFDGNYLVPKPGKYDMSLLPNCFVMDSREGENMTYFWFKIYDWRFGE
ncbi:hypothetical protein FSP39_002250 [Pinctada imbricata]|uniref:Uncharacterized protein n=1 Tax=Pinctada imbricata TaxID=66713 RepID=A0AA88Y8K8_PINIB|nr:hypothetical protein FSP39_002250 [Pinctada imbricata]